MWNALLAILVFSWVWGHSSVLGDAETLCVYKSRVSVGITIRNAETGAELTIFSQSGSVEFVLPLQVDKTELFEMLKVLLAGMLDGELVLYEQEEVFEPIQWHSPVFGIGRALAFLFAASRTPLIWRSVGSRILAG